ncbi:rhodanese-like domain-containing protein [Microbacterium sp. ZXX196]|uniref:rhodanese-like domain-containing protein n=1 Tax=Microbacterium sp. ZXX196 TaxID=2609291 RepID=UPI0013214508|nr:rhodanese-like domain-containing protein [Microbacterium sp. ZXX196]MTE23048.1 rhodanese-like domain-containing protein [Microbacterium sp. ZXX196]
MQEITVAELKARQKTPLIDVREADEFAAGRVPGAVNIPLSELGARLDELPSEFDVICHLGGRSAQAAAALESRGYDATNVAGGTAAWIEAGYEVER